MDRPPSDTLFSLLYKDFPSLGEHTIRSIINFSQNNINICYDACRKAVAAKSSQPFHPSSGGAAVPSGDAIPKRSPVRTRTSDPAFDSPELGESLPDWRVTPCSGSCSSGAGSCPQTNGSMLSYNHGQTPAHGGAGDFLSERHHLLLGSHRHSEPDVIGGLHSSAGASRASNQRMPGSYPGTSGVHQDPSLRGSPPVNGVSQLHIVTGEDNDMDDSWAQVIVSETGTPQMAQYLSPVASQLPRYTSEVNVRRTSNGGRTSAEFLEKILIQQHLRLEKLAQATASLVNTHLELQAEEARLTDEIMSTKKRKQANGFIGSSMAQELAELKLERSRLCDEVLSLEKQAATLTASARPAAAQQLPRIASPASSSRQQSGPVVGGTSPVTSGVNQAYPAPPAYTAHPGFFAAPVLPPYVTPGRGAPAAAPPFRQTVPPRPDPSSVPSPPLPPPRPSTGGQQQQRYPTSLVPPHYPTHQQQQRPPAPQWSTPARPPQPPPPHSDEGEQWSCSACTFLNHPTLSMCEMCDTPRM